jgi:hypothetical protein
VDNHFVEFNEMVLKLSYMETSILIVSICQIGIGCMGIISLGEKRAKK